MSLQPLVDVGESRRNLSSMYAPIAAELAEAERIFQDELGSRFPFVQQLVDHCADYRGKTAATGPRPPLGTGVRLALRGSSRPGGRRRDDPHGDARARRHSR